MRMDAVAVALGGAPGRHVDLDVRHLQSRIAAQEGAGEQARGGHQAAPAERILHAGDQLARHAARQVVQRDGLRQAIGAVGVEVIVQVGADPRHFADHGDAEFVQQVGGAEAGKLQQVRRSVGAARDDHLAARACRAQSLRRAVFDADRAAVLDQHARGVSLGDDGEVLPVARRTQIGRGGTPAAGIVGGGLVVAGAFLLRAVEVGGARDAGLHRRLHHRAAERPDMRRIGHAQRPADAVEFIARRVRCPRPS